jgi:hypothetical protein
VAVDFISPTRDFVQEGPITKISARSGERQSRYLFLVSIKFRYSNIQKASVGHCVFGSGVGVCV